MRRPSRIEKVASAIKTDFILSAEIMAITLAALPAGSIVTQALVLALVGIGITVAVYGVVALIVKADDVGLALANNDGASPSAASAGRSDAASFAACPCFLILLSAVGTAAMIWVGGGIVLHGLETIRPAFDRTRRPRRHGSSGSRAAGGRRPLKWIVEAAISGVIGLLIGAASIPVIGYGVAPAWKRVKGLLPGGEKRA